MDPQSIRDWKANMEAMNQVTLDEARNRTSAERWAMHKAFLVRLKAMGKLPEPHRDIEDHYLWSSIQRRFHAKQSKS